VSQPVRVLYAACERVPGPTASGTRLSQLILGFSGQLEADALSLKSEELAHIQRLGTARMMRVPQHEGGFVERISAFQRALKRQLEGDSYELCHASDAWAAAVASQHKEQSADLKVITELTELPTQTLTERHPGANIDDKVRNIMRRGETMVLQRSDALVVDSNAARAMLVQLGAREDRVHVVPPGVDDSVFFASSVELRLHDGQFKLLYVGPPEPGRGLNIFLQALKRLPPHVVALVCRVHAREPAGEEAVALLGLQDRVTWQDVPSAQKLAQAYQLADAVVLLPSAPPNVVHGGHIPRRLLEAMACRRVPICTDLPGVREVIQDRTNGLMVPQGHAGALADAVSLLAKDPTLRGRLAGRAQETATQFSWAGRLTTYRKLYSTLLGQNFEVEEKQKGRAGGLADRLKAQRAAKAPAVGIMRDEKANKPVAPPPPAARPPPPAAPPPAPPPRPAAEEPPPPAVMGRPLPYLPPVAPVSAPPPPGVPFGTPTSAPFASAAPGGAFGSPTSVPFGAPISGSFGAPASSPFGAPVTAPSGPPSAMTQHMVVPATMVPVATGVQVVMAPELPPGSVPKAWPFGAPVTGPDAHTAVPMVSVPSLPPVMNAADGSRPHFLSEPTPSSSAPNLAPIPPSHREPTPSPDLDPWGGDTLAVSQPPSQMDGLAPSADPFPGNSDTVPLQDPTQPLPPRLTLRGPPGMRSLALLDSVGQDMGLGGPTPRPSPGGATETERLEMTPTEMGDLYGRSQPNRPLTSQAAGHVKFGGELGSESPTAQHLNPIRNPDPEGPPPPPSHEPTPLPAPPTDEPTTT
jgi:glycosyltransferase involved in cell wall biosynthesis